MTALLVMVGGRRVRVVIEKEEVNTGRFLAICLGMGQEDIHDGFCVPAGFAMVSQFENPSRRVRVTMR